MVHPLSSTKSVTAVAAHRIPTCEGIVQRGDNFPSLANEVAAPPLRLQMQLAFGCLFRDVIPMDLGQDRSRSCVAAGNERRISQRFPARVDACNPPSGVAPTWRPWHHPSSLLRRTVLATNVSS